MLGSALYSKQDWRHVLVQINKYVLNEILNHSRLRHPHIVNFREVSTSLPRHTLLHPIAFILIEQHIRSRGIFSKSQARKSHCQSIQAFSFYSLPSSCKVLVATVSFALLQCFSEWTSWSFSCTTRHEVHADICLVLKELSVFVMSTLWAVGLS